MGCVSSRLLKEEYKRELIFSNGDYTNHIVCLTSTTYGVLNLDKNPKKEVEETNLSSPIHRVLTPEFQREVTDEPEIINTWELMKDLEEEIPISEQSKKSPSILQISPKHVSHADSRNSPEFFSRTNSSKNQKKFAGKENKNRHNGFHGDSGKSEVNMKQVLKPFNSLENFTPSIKNRTSSFRSDSKLSTSSRRSLSPFFDPELIASFDRELLEEREQIKKMVSKNPKICKTRDSKCILESFEKICPPGGADTVIIYTTTLRGIRKTFEDCNNVRSVVESHQVQIIERDISMDSGFREELRRLMGKRNVRVPLVFVKGRLIGGIDEVLLMEEEGKLGILFDGIPRAAMAGCQGCGGMRFVMCMDCSGSCKVLDEEQKKMVKCEECNENGLIHCPICC